MTAALSLLQPLNREGSKEEIKLTIEPVLCHTHV